MPRNRPSQRTISRPKSSGFISPNGRRFKSQAAYKRSLRGAFANMNQSQRKNFKTQTYFTTRKEKSKIVGINKSDIKNASIETVKVTTIKSKKEGSRYKLKEVTQTARVVGINKEDKDGNLTEIIESEESSRYTPSKVEYTVENLDDNVVQVTAKSDDRTVKSTLISTQPSVTSKVREADLEDRFIQYYKTPFDERKNLPDDVELSVREKVSLAKILGDIPTGAPTHRKLTPKLKKGFETRGVVFP